MTLHFCTYFDHRYLARALALHGSLKNVCPPFQLWALCMDTLSYDLLSKAAPPEIRPIALEALEKRYPELLHAKKSRSTVEYYFTCSPFLPQYILSTSPDVGMVTYLDADLFFYSDPAPLFEEMGNGSIAIIGHRFPPHLKELETFGIYNVGWLSFRRDERALECLRWWGERCIEWCHDRPEEGRFADQKYLDGWPQRFGGVVVLQNKGANLAPWNMGGYTLRVNGTHATVDGEPLIFFHFHGLKQLTSRVYDPQLRRYHLTTRGRTMKMLYRSYIEALREATRRLPNSSQVWQASIRGPSTAPGREAGGPIGGLLRDLLSRLRLAKGILARDLVLAP